MNKIKIGRIITSSTGEFTDINLIPVDKIKKGMTITIVNPAFNEFTKRDKAQYLDNLYHSDGSVVVALEDAYYNKAEKQFEFQGLIQYKNGENSVEQLIAFPKYKVETDKEDLDITDETLFPTDILTYLNKYIVGQDDAKRKLSIEIFKHYCRMNSSNMSLPKDNILLTGPTGCGKTYMVEKLAELIDVPFAKCSCTSLTEAGYVGDDVENVLKDLLIVADYDLDRAEFGIVFLDEIDKIGRKGANPSITRDVSGEGVQTALLNMLGNGIVKVPLDNGRRKNPNAEMIDFDTKNVLFIGAGCFEGIEDFVKNKKGISDKPTIGFNQIIEKENNDKNSFREEITREELKKFGMIPELLGRFGVISNLSELDEEALFKVCKLENGEIQKYKNLFAMFNKKLVLTDNLFKKIATKAYNDKTGARGVKTAISELLEEYTFNINTSSEKVINIA